MALYELADLAGERCALGADDGNASAEGVFALPDGRLRVEPPTVGASREPGVRWEYPAAAGIVAGRARDARRRLYADVPRQPAERTGAGDPGANGVDGEGIGERGKKRQERRRAGCAAGP